MRELEKILEEMKESSITVATSKEHYIHPQDGRFVEEVVLLDDIEKIIRKHMNDGWISVEERLPEDDRMVLVTCQTKKGIRSVNRAYCDGAFWHGSGSMSGVIAWRPLPEPYRPEKERGRMRLIDADLLTEEIESLRCTLTGLRAGKGVLARAADEYRKSILQIISDQPTAFDKEKVTRKR